MARVGVVWGLRNEGCLLGVLMIKQFAYIIYIYIILYYIILYYIIYIIYYIYIYILYYICI